MEQLHDPAVAGGLRGAPGMDGGSAVKRCAGDTVDISTDVHVILESSLGRLSAADGRLGDYRVRLAKTQSGASLAVMA